MGTRQKTPDPLERQLEEIQRQLATLRDEVRVHLHLANMDLKDRWRLLEPRVHELERWVKTAPEATREAMVDLVKQVRRFRDELRDIAEAGRRA